MPYNTMCDHRRCDGEPCKMLTPEELEPSPEDLAQAKVLIDGGWKSTSNRFRNVARFVIPQPDIKTMLTPEALTSYHGQRLVKHYNQLGSLWHGCDLRCGDEGVEKMTLSVNVFRAFKKLGGRSA